jgi:hypothetical protein
MIVVALTATAMSLTGCTRPALSGAGRSPAPSPSATATASATDDPSPSPTGATRARTRPVTTTTRPSARSTVTSVDQDACSQETLLPLMKQKFDNQAPGLIIERVDIKRCRNHYAHVFAVTGPTGSASTNYENEQLFLRYVNGRWESIAEGTGISCDDPDIRSNLVSACRALGYLD